MHLMQSAVSNKPGAADAKLVKLDNTSPALESANILKAAARGIIAAPKDNNPKIPAPNKNKVNGFENIKPKPNTESPRIGIAAENAKIDAASTPANKLKAYAAGISDTDITPIANAPFIISLPTLPIAATVRPIADIPAANAIINTGSVPAIKGKDKANPAPIARIKLPPKAIHL